MKILGIETSCDDTAVSVVEANRSGMRLLSHVQYSQIPVHAKYGGVVPEVAAREHAVTIIPTLDHALMKAGTKLSQIDILAVTQGPGLAPALSVGVDTARWISAMYKIPIVGINHIEGHIASTWNIEGVLGASTHAPSLPALALVVSGGHTELLLVKKFGSYTLLGKTRDDAAGEAFDKVATLLGLPYPGGPEISRAAKLGNSRAFDFPRPMLNDTTLDFSFAGLKTSVRYQLQKHKRKTKKLITDVSASFEQAVVDTLVGKTLRALSRHPAQSVLVVGGVSANVRLRSALTQALPTSLDLHPAPSTLTSDNATMICMAAHVGKKRASTTIWKTLEARPRWELGNRQV